VSRSNVYCTNCGREFIAELDLGLNGNHEIICPHCQHVHYRVVRDGVVTEDRYRSSAGPTIRVNVSTTVTVTTNYYTINAGTTLSAAWLNRSDLNTVA
jgi:DNA-directed RNA polymerase subunit RPC12/RpoP